MAGKNEHEEHDPQRGDAPAADAGPEEHRTHGRSRMRTGQSTVAAIVAVTGVALAVMAITDRLGPQPTASPTPGAPSVTTPVAAPTTPTVVLPTGDPSLPFGACGSLASTVPTAPVTDAALMDVRTDGTDLAAGDRLAVSAWVRPVSWSTMLAVPADGPRYAVLSDGVVVGTAAQHGTTTTDWQMVGDLVTGTTHSDRIELTVCTPEDQGGVTVGAPLPGGVYTVVPWAEVKTLPVEDALAAYGDPEAVDALAASVAESMVVRGESIPITIAGPYAPVAPRPGDGHALAVPPVVDELVCGDPAPEPAADGDLTLEVIDTDAPEIDLRYSGPGRARGSLFDYLSLWAVQDGVVVGGTWYETEGGRDFDLADGPGIRSTLVGDMSACPDQYGRTPLPAGEYQVYAAARTTVGDRVLPDGTVVAGEGPTYVVSEPWTVTFP